MLDTAEAYGDAAESIGAYHGTSRNRFEVISRFSPKREDLPPDFYERVLKNLAITGVDRLYAYMFHSYADYVKHFASQASALQSLKRDGLILKTGVSVYTNDECERLTEQGGIDLIQLPYSVLDNLSQRGEVLSKARDKGIEIHARSAFLQGLVFRDPDELPNDLVPLAPYLRQLRQLAASHHLSLQRLALGYAVQGPSDKVVIGVDTPRQLDENLSDLTVPLPEDVISAVNRIHVSESRLLNPSNWPSVKVLAITQARSGSTRLPGKVLKEIKGEPLLLIHLKRVLRSRMIDRLIVATTLEEADQRIADIAGRLQLPVYRGSVTDVLARYYEAARPYQPEWIVRITSDCPLIDPETIDLVITEALSSGADYCSNTLKPGFPDGMDVEVFRFGALEKAYREATSPGDREHVTPYIYRNSDFKGGSLFRAVNVSAERDFGHVRLTVDEQADLQVITRLVESLGTDKDWRSYANHYLDTDIRELNEKTGRNEGFQDSR
jgi:spore coat polysaccharide biosynthesis protein SpsF